jgi:hypothetical protein
MKAFTKLDGIESEELTATASIFGTAARLALHGTADTRAMTPLDDLLRRLHKQCAEHGVLEVSVDFRNLEFMNSSCFKAFVTWVSTVRELDPARQYKLTFLSDRRKHWQKRSLGALSCFAVGLIKVET